MKRRELLRQELASSIRHCQKCPGLNIPLITEAVPGYGSLHSPLMLVGQSLCGPCMSSKIPFTKGSGRLVDMALSLAQTRKDELFITNTIHCHPPGNRPSLDYEKANCKMFLQQEYYLVKPKLIVCLGKDAREAIVGITQTAKLWDADLSLQESPETLVSFLHHPSYIMRQSKSLREAYVQTLAAAIGWAFRRPILRTEILI